MKSDFYNARGCPRTKCERRDCNYLRGLDGGAAPISIAPRGCRPSPGAKVRHSCLRGHIRHRVTFVLKQTWLRRYGRRMARNRTNESAEDLWRQVFANLAKHANATLMDPAYDPTADEEGLRDELARVGWSASEIDLRIRIHKDATATAPVTSPGINPVAELIFGRLCDDGASSRPRRIEDKRHRDSREHHNGRLSAFSLLWPGRASLYANTTFEPVLL
jgi:hypothetical protein